MASCSARTVGGLMGMMDGGMGGFMGGMMGTMLGVVVNLSPAAAWVTAALLVLLFIVCMAALIRLVQTSTARAYALDTVCGMTDPTAYQII